MEYYSAIKKNEMIPFAASRIDLESVILSEARQRGEIPCDIPYIWNIKWYKWTHLQNRKWLTDLENKLMVAGGKV